MDQPDPLTDIEKYFGEEKTKYIKNKNKGGISNAKGNNYELHYAIYQIAKYAPRVLEHGEEIYILSQAEEFVDDLQLGCIQKNWKFDYQLKNSKQVSWDKGKHPISEDFNDQQKLNSLRGRESKQYLIVSDMALANKLNQSKPSEIAAFSHVEYFSEVGTVNARLLSEKDFHHSINYLCAYPNSSDKLEIVAGLLMTAYKNTSQSKNNIIEILHLARKHNPSCIRIFGTTLPLLEAVKEILNNIPDFDYDLDRGYFKWQYLNGLYTGQLLYDCNDTKFRKFEELILKEKPACFEELEGLLL